MGGKVRGESERMRRARGARIIGQADALAASRGGASSTVERSLPRLALFLMAIPAHDKS
jgi:hypothetical protein